MLSHCIFLRRCMPPCHGYRQRQMEQIRHGSMKGYGCSVSQYLILHIIKGKVPECPCITDWDDANLVQYSRLHLSDRSPPTGQTGLIRGRAKLLFQDLNTVSRRKRRSRSLLPTKRSLKPMLLCRSVDVPSQKPAMANDHEAGSSKGVADKYHQPRWCPSGLTHTQKRKLQRLRNKEKKNRRQKR